MGKKTQDKVIPSSLPNMLLVLLKDASGCTYRCSIFQDGSSIWSSASQAGYADKIKFYQNSHLLMAWIRSYLRANMGQITLVNGFYRGKISPSITGWGPPWCVKVRFGC